MTKSRFRDMGSPDADIFLRGKHPKKLSYAVAKKAGLESKPLSKPEPEPIYPISSSPEVLPEQLAKIEVIDPIKPAEFQRPDYFHLQRGQEIYVGELRGTKIKAFVNGYDPSTRSFAIYLADESGEIDYSKSKTVHQSLVYVKQ